MRALLKWIARLAGIGGATAIAFAIAVRLAGAYVVGGFQVGTILQAGIAAAVIACLAYLVVLAETIRP